MKRIGRALVLKTVAEEVKTLGSAAMAELEIPVMWKMGLPMRFVHEPALALARKKTAVIPWNRSA